MAKDPKLKPGSGGGPVQNAKAQPKQKQVYGKGSKPAPRSPSKKPGLINDGGKSKKASPFAAKKGK